MENRMVKAMKEYTAEDICNLIRKRFASRNGLYNQCVVLEQVPNGNGTEQSRWIDVAAFEMWPSKGLTRSAFEIKVSRADFVHELQNPEKHQWCKDCFHEFWFVAPKEVIQLEELPTGTGWMYPGGKGLSVARQAIRNDNPKLDDYLLSGFMRAAYKEIHSATKISTKRVLDESEEYKRAQMFSDAVQKFLNSRGISCIYPKSVDEIYAKLEDATLDKQLKQDRDQLLSVSGHFQKEIFTLLKLFILIAQRSLIARDEMGKYLVTAYGGFDEDSLESLKELAKDPKAMTSQKRYAEIIEIIMKWDLLKD